MSRRRRRLAVALSVALAACLAGAPAALADVCDEIPGIPLAPNPAKTVCKLGKTVVSDAPKVVTNPGKVATDIVTAPIKAAGDEVMEGITSWVGKGAAWLVGQTGKLIGETTTPRLQSDWFVGQYATMGALAALFALPLLLLSVLQAVLRRDGALLARAAFVQLPLAFVLTAMAVTIVALFLELTDGMSSQVAGSVGSDANAFFSDVGKSLDSLLAAPGGSAPVPLFAVFLGGLIAAIGAFFVWVELLIRSAAIYVAVLFLPFTFIAMIWPATARWCRRLIELLFAIVFSKFVIVAIMSLAAAGLGQSRGGDAFQGVLAGAALMALAAFSPMVLLRLIPLAETAAHTNWRSGAGSQTLGPVAGPAAVMRRVTDANWGAATTGGLRAAPAGAAAGIAAGGAQTMAAGMRNATATAAETASGSGPTTETAPPGGDLRYAAAAGGGGQAARPAPAGTSSSPSAAPPAARPAGPASAGPQTNPPAAPRPADPAAGQPPRPRRDAPRDGRGR